MHGPRPRRLTAALATLSLAFLAACGGSGSDSDSSSAKTGDIDPKGELTFVTTAVPTGFDPHKEAHRGERPYSFLVFDRLTRTNSKGELEPMLATKWAVSDDAKSVTFTLRDDVTFHDGTAFDAEAVKINVERVKTIQGGTQAQVLAGVESVDVVSPTEVTFNLSSPDVEFPEVVAGPAGAIISPAAIKDDVDLLTDPGLAGSGPYVLDEFVPSEKAVFVQPEDKDKNWDPEAGRLARLEARFILDDRTTMSAMRSNEADVAYINSLSVSTVNEAEKLGDSDGFQLLRSDTNVLNAVLFRGSKVSDLKVRQALSMAIDTKAIADGLLQGTCKASDQIVREGQPGFIEDFENPYSYDPDAAKKLLAEAGATELELEVVFITGREAIPTVVQENLKAVGVTAKLTPLSSVEALTTWRSEGADVWPYQVTPSGAASRVGDDVLGPVAFGQDVPVVSDAIKKARGETDDAARAEAYKEINAAAIDQALAVPLCHFDAFYLATDKVVNFESAPLPGAQYLVDLRYVAKTK